MTESQKHRELIDTIVGYVQYRFPFIENGECFIDGIGERPPSMPDGSIPDFYCESNGYIIIGEAKTTCDIDNAHSEKQLLAYLQRSYASESNDDLNRLIVYAVPNEYIRYTKRYLESIAKNNGFQDIEIHVTSPLDLFIEKQSENGSNQKIHVKREAPIETKIEAFDYQKEAFQTVKDLEYAAIFHEQGLGKTKIAMDLLVYWLKNKIIDTVLIVTKKSLLYNWDGEFKKHTTIKPKMLGTKKGKNYYVFNSPCRAVLANFETVVSEKDRFELFLKSRSVGIIIDESAKIKNPNSKLTKTFFIIGIIFMLVKFIFN